MLSSNQPCSWAWVWAPQSSGINPPWYMVARKSMFTRWIDSGRFYFLGLQNHCWWWLIAIKLKDACSLKKKALINLESVLKSRDIICWQNYGFSSSPVWMWEVDHKQGWSQKNWCFWTVVLEKTLESPLDCKIKPVNSKRKSTLNIHWKNWCWSSNTLATWCKEPTYWKRTWSWERLRAGGEGSNRRKDGWIASPTQWTWVWANSGR